MPIYADEKLLGVEAVAVTDQAFFEVFDFEMLTGDVTKLEEPNQIIVSRQFAEKMGKNINDIIGESLSVGGNYNVSIAGVMEDFPVTTDLPFTMVLSRKTMEQEININMWHSLGMDASTFVVLNKAEDLTQVTEGLEPLLVKNTNERMAEFFDLTLQPLRTLHFDSEYGNYNNRVMPKNILWGLSGVASILLVIACINFINLSTANAIKRSREVGIRKILGSSSKQLIGKFIAEAAVMTILSFAVAIPLAKSLHSSVERLVGFDFDFNLLADTTPWLVAVVLSAFIVLVAGIYPAVVTARFQPIAVLKQDKVQGSGVILRKILVIFQFTVSQVLLIGLFVVQGQLNYFLEADMGFDREGILTINLPGDPDTTGKVKAEFLRVPGVSQVSMANSSPISGNRMINSFSYEGAPENETNFTEVKLADTDYLDMFQFDLLAGRNYFAGDSIQELLVNETLMHQIGIESPEEAIGAKVLLGPGEPDVIVGVVSDFNFSSMYEKIGPVVISTEPANFSVANVKIGVKDITTTIAGLERAWTELYPDEAFEYEFLDEAVNSYYEREQRLSEVILWFTIIALFIGGIGLYGMVTYVVNNRLKEIGIRKVLGASFQNLIQMISREFLILLAIAFLISAPLAWYLMNGWLADFHYRMELGPFLFLVAFLSSMLVALASVLQKSVQATRINPVETLRNE